MDKMGKRRPVVSAFCCAMLLSSSTWGATVEPGQGNLVINQGQGFQPVNSRIDANVGDSVMVGPDGSATVVYDDGCTVDVQPGSVMTISPISPCASGSNAQGPPPGPPPGPAPLGEEYFWNGFAWVLVAAGAAGVITVIATSPSSKTPTTP